MKDHFGILIILVCLFPAHLAFGDSPSQGDTSKSEDNKTKHVDQNTSTTPRPDSSILLHIKISAQGMEAVPNGSSIDLKGNQETCRKLERTQNLQAGNATFPDLPVCKVQLRIFITGFNTLLVCVDLANYQDPLRILVKHNEPPEANEGPLSKPLKTGC
jgi:hypothetical protein